MKGVATDEQTVWFSACRTVNMSTALFLKLAASAGLLSAIIRVVVHSVDRDRVAVLHRAIYIDHII